MGFKFLNDYNDTVVINLDDYLETMDEPRHMLTFNNNYYREHPNNEYCMQFDDEEPFVFASGNNELNISIRPTAGGEIVFTHNGRRFKLFARERQ